MRRNPLLYSDQVEIEDTRTIESLAEPAEQKLSFIFYFIVLANLLLVALVLLIIWSLFSNSSNASFDQQLKAWTQQLFNPTEQVEVKAAKVPPPKTIEINIEQEKAAAKEKELIQLEEQRLEQEQAQKAKQDRLEALAVKLQEEKAKADAIQKQIDENQAVETTKEEPIVVPNAARDIPTQPENTTKTQLEKILETMQNQ